MVSEIVYIYGLIDPLTNKLRYIGKSVNPYNRFRRHIADRNIHDSYKDRWIRLLVENKQKPELILIDVVDKNEWCYWEKFYIQYFKFIGCDLVNGTNGGDEPPSTKGRKHKLESKLKMSQTKKGKPIPWLNNGKPRSDEHKENLSKSLKGRSSEKKGKSYEEIYGVVKGKKLRKKLSESHKNKNMGEEHPMFGKKHTEETIEKIKEARSRQIITEDTRKKMAESNRIKVYKYDLGGTLVKVYNSLGEAYEDVGYKKLKKHFNSGEPLNGYIWKKQKKNKQKP